MENAAIDHVAPIDLCRHRHEPEAICLREDAQGPFEHDSEVHDSCTQSADAGSGGLNGKVLERTMSYIQANLFNDLSLGDLARIACISRYHFARMFRASTGHSPMKYVRNERIEVAKSLLADNKANISSVAAALGFFDQSHFSRVFRKVTGVSPGRYAHGHEAARAVERN